MTEQLNQTQNRLIAIDRMKGFCIFLMLFITAVGYFPSFGFLYTLAAIPKSNRIAVMAGVNLADYETPFFLFLIGMSYALSFKRRAEISKPKAYLHFIQRYLIFVGLGGMMATFDSLSGNNEDPTIVMTVLFFAVLLLGLVWLVLFLLKERTKKAKVIVGKIVFYTLIFMGVLEIVFGAIDLVHQFTWADELALHKSNYYMHWSILHAIGFSGLLGVLFAGLSLKNKIIFGSVYTVLYTCIQMIPMVEQRRDILVLGGMYGCFGWVIVIVSGMILVELYLLGKKLHYPYLIALVIYLIFTVLSVLFLSSSARGVSVNFVLTSVAGFGLMFYVISLFDNIHLKFDILAMWGKNPLFVFFLGCLLKIILLVTQPAMANVFQIVLYFAFSTFIVVYIPYLLDKKNIIIKL